MMTSPRIRVLFCIQSFAGGGAEGVTLSLARALAPAQFAPTIFAHERFGEFEPPASTPEVPIVIHNRRDYRRRELPGLFAKTLQLVRTTDVVVGANEGRPTFFALAAAKLLGKPCVVWTHYNMHEFLRSRSWRQLASLRSSALADRLVSCGRDVLESAIRVTGIRRDRAVAIANGIPIASIQQRAAEPVLPADAILFEKPTILGVGHLTEEKDYPTLLAAHARLRAEGGSQALLLLGTGRMESALRERATALGIGGSTHLLGYRSNPYSYMHRCTVFGHPSRQEGFGLVLAEALACGASVVATDCPSGPREILDGGRAGILVPVGDVPALAQALGRVLFDPAERERLRRAAPGQAAVYDVANWARQWGKLLVQLHEEKSLRAGKPPASGPRS